MAKNMRGEREFILECEREEGERRSERRQIWRKTDGLTERENTKTGSGWDIVWQKAMARRELDANNMQMMQAMKCAGEAKSLVRK